MPGKTDHPNVKITRLAEEEKSQNVVDLQTVSAAAGDKAAGRPAEGLRDDAGLTGRGGDPAKGKR